MKYYRIGRPKKPLPKFLDELRFKRSDELIIECDAYSRHEAASFKFLSDENFEGWSDVIDSQSYSAKNWSVKDSVYSLSYHGLRTLKIQTGKVLLRVFKGIFSIVHKSVEDIESTVRCIENVIDKASNNLAE